MITRGQVTEAARTYMGTPFLHQGRVKGVGIDCAGLLICVARDLGVREDLWDVSGYGRSPQGDQLREHLRANMDEIDPSDSLEGDVLLMKFLREPQHIALKTASDYIIHSYASVGKVVEHRLDSMWASRIVSAFRFREMQT